jgi:hypothetical protein
MEILARHDIPELRLPGRTVQKAIGKDGEVRSRKMTVGFARYSADSGVMQPHHHAEETIYVIDAKDSWVRNGSDPGNLASKTGLERGMLLHFDDLEWHVFEYDEGGFLDIVFIYGQVDDIRPEERSSS